eukprot:2073547-Lingulodinium_polyedra.AAC.1
MSSFCSSFWLRGCGNPGGTRLGRRGAALAGAMPPSVSSLIFSSPQYVTATSLRSPSWRELAT